MVQMTRPRSETVLRKHFLSDRVALGTLRSPETSLSYVGDGSDGDTSKSQGESWELRTRTEGSPISWL